MFATITLRDLSKPVRQRHSKVTGPYTWTPSDPTKGRGWYADKRGGTDSRDSTFRLRVESANDHLSGRMADIDGYYCDNDGFGDTLQPVIFRLPRSRGFLAGWTMGPSMCGALERHIWIDAEDAAQEAHRLADSDAEDARLDDETDTGEDE